MSDDRTAIEQSWDGNGMTERLCAKVQAEIERLEAKELMKMAAAFMETWKEIKDV